MTYNELVSNVAASTGMTKIGVKETMAAVGNSVIAAVTNGETVKIPGFGSFSPVTRAARKGRNPATGEAVDIPEKRDVRFKPASFWKDDMNRK